MSEETNSRQPHHDPAQRGVANQARRSGYPRAVNPLHWLRNRCFPLFIALVTLLLGYPLFDVKDTDATLLGASLFGLLPAIGVISLAGKKGIAITLTALVVCLGFAINLRQRDIPTALVGLPGICVIGYYIFSTIMVAHAVFKKDSVQDDRIYGGISIYLLVGIVFGIIHHRINEITPGAYQSTMASAARTQQFRWDDFLYYSFTTLTTMGYGDIVPVSPQARSMALLEATFGVLYPAVLIARLVNLPSPVGARGRAQP